ncbi:MAG: hypothetical protein ISS72_08265 [Candidatus Brocadiae bacterium]|nr:hypothetical protein [Candidatus Brocadiia bacterium]
MHELHTEGLMSLCLVFLATVPAAVCGQAPAVPAERPFPVLAMYPPGQDDGRCFRELFEQPDAWAETRGAIDVLGYADHVLNRQFTDEELAEWLPRLGEWGLTLELEVGAVKEWGPTGEQTFNAESPLWDRFQKLGGAISSIAMDEPLCCVRKSLQKPDEYAVEETADFIARVRERYPEVLIGDIEPCPFIPVPELIAWIEALQQRLAEKQVRGLDFFRLDVDWLHYVRGHGAWPDVRELETYCRSRGIPFSLIYWAADYPALAQRGLADDSTWYVGIMRQGNDYANVDGKPDQFVIESWIGAPSRSVPETGDFTFTRSVLDFARRFVPRDK